MRMDLSVGRSQGGQVCTAHSGASQRVRFVLVAAVRSGIAQHNMGLRRGTHDISCRAAAARNERSKHLYRRSCKRGHVCLRVRTCTCTPETCTSEEPQTFKRLMSDHAASIVHR